MKFKNESSKPGGPADHLHDSTSTSSSSGGKNVNQHSGIYDVSRMTNLRTPTNPSQYTSQQASENAKRDKKKSELIRGLLMAVAIPLVAGAGYLVFFGGDFSFQQNLIVDPTRRNWRRRPCTGNQRDTSRCSSRLDTGREDQCLT
jgi:hypothetical protein